MGLQYFFLIDLIVKDVLLCYQEKIADRFSHKENFCHLYQWVIKYMCSLWTERPLRLPVAHQVVEIVRQYLEIL